MKKVHLLIWLLVLSCSNEQNQSIQLRGVYATNEVVFANASYVEIDMNGITITSEVHPKEGGMVSGFFDAPLGRNTVTKVEVFDELGNRTHFAMPLDSLGARNGLIVTGVPFETSSNITQQLFEK